MEDITWSLSDLYMLGTRIFSVTLLQFISLHIRSMWETICDASASWSGWNFGPNSTVYTYSVEYPLPLPPQKKLKFRQILAL